MSPARQISGSGGGFFGRYGRGHFFFAERTEDRGNIFIVHDAFVVDAHLEFILARETAVLIPAGK